jgi:hypothetical protein
VLAAGSAIHRVRAGRSLGSLDGVLEVLACLEPSHDAPFERAFATILDELAGVSAVVAVVQDWDEPRRDLLRRVRLLGAEVRVVIVRDGAPTLEAREEEGLSFVEVLAPNEVEARLATSEAW